MKTIAFFNNKGGVGKTSLAYHLAYMFAEKNLRVLAVDLDPQANLTSMFLEEDRLEDLWPDGVHTDTISGVIDPIMRGTGDYSKPHIEFTDDDIGLIVGDLALASFEDSLSDAWPRCQVEDEAAFRKMTAFYRAIHQAAAAMKADVALIDVGPNLGAINRSAIIASDHIVVPLAPDLFSLQGLKNLGPTLRKWRKYWDELYLKNPNPELPIPKGTMEPLGYVVLQHSTRIERPVKSYAKWIDRIPRIYSESVLTKEYEPTMRITNDYNCLTTIKHYRSLMAMAMESRKPLFMLKPADGAIGGHASAVRECYDDFSRLADTILTRCDISNGS